MPLEDGDVTPVDAVPLAILRHKPTPLAIATILQAVRRLDKNILHLSSVERAICEFSKRMLPVKKRESGSFGYVPVIEFHVS